MRRSSERLHPGARLFGNALASIKFPAGEQKMKCMDTGITEVSIPVSLRSYPVSVVDKTHLPHIVGNWQTNLISEIAAEDDYSLPIVQPVQYSMPYHPGVYQSSDVYSAFYYSTTSQFGSSTNHSSDVVGSSMVPCRTSTAYFSYSAHHSNPFQDSDGAIYGFSCSSLANNESELSPNIFTDPGISSRMSPEPFNASNDYRLPLTLPASAPDSGYPSSDDDSSSEIAAEDDNSLPIVHPVQSSIPYHPGVYQSSDVHSPFYSSTTSQFGSSTNHSSDVFGSSMVPCRTSTPYFNYSAHHSNPFQDSDGAIYGFSCSSLAKNQSELSPNIFTDPGISSRMSPEPFDASDDYRLPLTLPASAPDSEYPSSDDGSSSGLLKFLLQWNLEKRLTICCGSQFMTRCEY